MNTVGGATSLHRHGEVPIGSSEMGSVVTVLSTTGGVGASTVATNLAVRLASKLGQLRPEVALMDADLAFGSATSMVGARPPRSLADLDSHVTQELLLAAMQPLESGIEVLAAPADPIVAERVVPATCARVIWLLAQRNTFTVIDAAPGLNEPALTAVDHADVVLIPVLGTPTAVRATAIVVGTLRRIGVADDRIRIVANRVGAAQMMPPGNIADAVSGHISWSIPDSADVVLAARKGRLLAWDWPDHPVSAALDLIAADVIDTVGAGHMAGGIGHPLRRVA